MLKSFIIKGDFDLSDEIDEENWEPGFVKLFLENNVVDTLEGVNTKEEGKKLISDSFRI